MTVQRLHMRTARARDRRVRLEAIAQQYAAWQPALTLWQSVLQAIDDPLWADMIPQLRSDRPAPAPLLDGAHIAVEAPRMVRWVRHLAKLAAENVTPSLSLVTVDQNSALELMEAALCQDTARIAALAQAIGAEPQVLHTIGHLSVLPLLQTCGQYLADQVPSIWSAGYCPICGAWPALAEVRGLEHRRALRCARCGGDWRTTWLCCPFCGESDHRRLEVLMPEDNGITRKIDVCTTCKGYVKTLTTLQVFPASVVPLEDLATIDLDVAALDRGYTRPERAAYDVATRLIVKSGHWRSIFGWRA